MPQQQKQPLPQLPDIQARAGALRKCDTAQADRAQNRKLAGRAKSSPQRRRPPLAPACQRTPGHILLAALLALRCGPLAVTQGFRFRVEPLFPRLMIIRTLTDEWREYREIE